MTEELKITLSEGLTALGLTPPSGAVDKLALYCDLLLEKNQVMNLTAITDPAEVVRLHFLDSAALLPARVIGHDHRLTLKPARMVSPDIRAGIAMLLAAMSARNWAMRWTKPRSGRTWKS